MDHAAVEFLGLTFSPASLHSAARGIVAKADRREAFAYVTTPNVDHIVKLAREPARRAVYADAWLTLNDSRILQTLARASGVSLPASPGSDLAERLFAQFIHPDEPVVVIGAEASVIDGLKRRYGLQDVRWHAPPMGLARNPKAIADAAAFIARNPARFVFLCVGAPQQEMIAWTARLRGDCTGVGLCVGAALEFLAGTKRRAPGWAQRARLEWAHRLLTEPRRLFRRYLVEGPEIVGLWLRWTAQRSTDRAAIASRS